MNTTIGYSYQDGGNYKLTNSMTFPGEITESQKKRILAAIEPDGDFVPEAVGMPECRFGEWDPETDHAFCNMSEDSFDLTDYEADTDVTLDELVVKFEENADKWTEIADRIAEEMNGD